MATARVNDVVYNLVKSGAVELENADLDPWYTSLVLLPKEKVIVVDSNAKNVRLHRIQDGRRLAEYIPKSYPVDICICYTDDDEIQMAVSLPSGQIEILSVKCTGETPNIRRMNSFNVRTCFDSCYGLKYFNKKLVVSGRKQGNICWGIMSITDGRILTVDNICKWRMYYSSFMCTNNKDMVYISCYAGPECRHNSGVYGYRNYRREFLYQHEDLKIPSGVTVDTRGHVFVCNIKPPSIHVLTESGQPLTIHRQGIHTSSRLIAIEWDKQQGLLYVTSNKSNVITRYRPEYSDDEDPVIPAEVLKMDSRSLHMYKEALRGGKEKVYNIRVMVVGQYGVGKTTLTKRLLGKDVHISERKSTEGIDIDIECSKVSLETGEWTAQEKNLEQDYRLQRLAKVLIEKQSARDRIDDGNEVVSTSQGTRTLDTGTNLADKEQVKMDPVRKVLTSDSNANVADDEQIVIPPQEEITSDSNTNVANKEQVEVDPMREMIKLLQENADKLKQDTGKTSPLTMWDFAGQYAFYTTHQTFLTRRAIYLLVSDVSGQVTDRVDDECYFDSEGITKCRVHELIEVWLNSIHSCAPSPEASIPPVILVGTHVDKITQKQLPAKGIELETQITSSETEEFTLPTTSTPAAATIKEQPKALIDFSSLMNFWSEPCTPQYLREITLPELDRAFAGAHALPAEDQVTKQRKLKLWPEKKKSIETEVMAVPSTVNPVGEKVVDVDAQKRYRNEICERYFKEIRTYLKDKPTRFHLVDEDFAIDNTVADSKLEDLKRKIVEVASQQSYWGEEIPTRWLPLEQELMRLKAAGVKVIPRSLLEDLNQAGAVQIATDELDLFLRFQHEIGTVLYFSMEVLREKIVLDPQWMIDALKSLITAEMFVQRSTPAVSDRWYEFKNNGKLYPELIDAVWTEKNPELHANKDHILLIMEQLNIIAKPRSFNEVGEKVENYFLAPCMLRQQSPKEVISPEQDSSMVTTSVLCYIFKGKFLPPPIFHRLLAACVARWPIAKKKETSENLIFCGCCVFDLGLFHRLTLYFKNHVVSARITRKVIDEVETPDVKLCTRVRKFITLNLSKITSCLDQNLQYELYVKSPPSQGVREDDPICVSHWFADEGHDPDGPIMPEHMNHARLCVAIVTVCGNALREILLTHVPGPYTNIYQAILANKADLTSRRQVRRGQWQNAPLNQNQSQAVFSDPLCRYVAALDQLDISLLYVLIRSISTVPPPLIDWGFDPPDQPRDRSLGASVERIRSYRNQIVGHSMDGKISQQDFDDYWNKIDTVLDDIEVALGRRVYREQLERQKRQVISIYEAC